MKFWKLTALREQWIGPPRTCTCFSASTLICNQQEVHSLTSIMRPKALAHEIRHVTHGISVQAYFIANVGNEHLTHIPRVRTLQIASARNKANLRAKILDFRGFDASIFLTLRGGIVMSRNYESTNLNRHNLSREIGRKDLSLSLSIYIYIYIYIYVCIVWHLRGAHLSPLEACLALALAASAVGFF